MAQRSVTVNDVLDGHVALDLDDRIYLNGYVPNLQVLSPRSPIAPTMRRRRWA